MVARPDYTSCGPATPRLLTLPLDGGCCQFVKGYDVGRDDWWACAKRAYLGADSRSCFGGGLKRGSCE